eukprot:9467252-Pyramimonas_sp.AAC.1
MGYSEPDSSFSRTRAKKLTREQRTCYARARARLISSSVIRNRIGWTTRSSSPARDSSGLGLTTVQPRKSSKHSINIAELAFKYAN